uniref:Rhodanese domain-containing protein n=1 Tax=Opuntia streptacantha TaxID=393608 RepID=A0A7C8YQ58_OPUST
MEALNALGLKPICVLPDQRSKLRKVFQISAIPSPKSSISSNSNTNPLNLREQISRNLHGSLALLASSLSAKFATALTYEEALQQSMTSNSGSDFDVGSVIDSIVDNPVLVAGGVAIIALPLVLSRVLGGKPKPFGVESAKNAYAKLADDPNAQLLDIRSLKELREVGTPDVRGLKKKPVSIVYKGEDKPGFLQKLSLRFKEPENTTLYILDKFDGNSELVAELVTANGFKAAYAIKDGAEGPRGWMNSGLPWILPQKAFSLDFGGLTEAFSLDDGIDALPLTLGVAAAAGVGFLALTEIETVLQLVGSAALIQLFSKKLLFAEDRKQTLQQLDEFLVTKIAPKELVSDIKQIGTALLPTTVMSRALPAPAEAAPETPAAAETALKTETAPQSEPQAQAVAQPKPEVNSAPQKEVEAKSHFRALSPYPSYPDLKPPTSPSPSQP